MSDPVLDCPKCGEKIRLTESLAGPILAQTRKEFENRLKEKDNSIAEKARLLQGEKDRLEAERAQLQERITAGVEAEREKIATQEKLRAEKLSALEVANQARQLEEMKALVADRENKLNQSQQAQAQLMKQQREFEEEKRNMAITIETRVAKEAELVRAKAQEDAQGQMDLKVKEKEMTISAMQKQIDDLKRRAEQGSQQAQGEVLELELETVLKEKFVFDAVEPVAKGVRGGDIVQSVMSPNGAFCGRILWETKRAKNWSAGWIAKLKEDQRRANADIAIIMTAVLPTEIKRFGQVDNVWVTDYESAFSLVEALRITLIQVANTKAVQSGQQNKMELMYDYLTGPRFRHRIEAIVEKFSDMRADLEREKKVMTKNWAKREAQIDGVIASTLGMYGDLEGIAGQVMPEIDGLETPMLEED